MTVPAGTVVLGARVIEPIVRFAPVIVVVAAAWVRLTTFGTATCGRPDETTSATALPVATWLPEIGDWLMTEPAATVVLVAVVMAPTVRFAPVIAVVAAACVRPTTFGPGTCGRPARTTRAEALPLATSVPDIGDWLMTEPAGMVVLVAVVTAPTVRLTPVIAVVAAACVRPTTFGTATCGGPVDTTIAMAVPATAWTPA